MAEQGVFFMERFAEHKQFNTVAEMDAHVQAVLTQHDADLNKTDRAVLDYLKQRATKVVGVAYVKVATVAAAIEKSVRTVNYSTKKLEGLGIIKKLEVMREKKGGCGANAYIICSSNCSTDCRGGIAEREEAETLTASKDEQPKSDTLSLNSFNSFKSSKEKELKKSEKAAPAIPFTVELFPNIPERIKQSLALLGDNKLGNDIWKKVVQAYVQSDLYNEMGNVHLQQLIEEDEMLYAELKTKIHNVVYAQAHGTVKTDVLGFIYGTCKGYFNDAAKAIIEDKTSEFNYDEMYNSMLKNADRFSSSYVPANVLAYERTTKEELDELGLF